VAPEESDPLTVSVEELPAQTEVGFAFAEVGAIGIWLTVIATNLHADKHVPFSART
jgi:hypothetical protein